MSSERSHLLPEQEKEIQRLLLFATSIYANSPKVVLAGILCEDGGDAKMDCCEDDSPNMGEIVDGKFMWPWRSISAMGSANIEEIGSFVFMCLNDAEKPNKFQDFAREAGAILLAASPNWLPSFIPISPNTLWTLAIIFLSPNCHNNVKRMKTGSLIVLNPWASSITALRDILNPPKKQVNSTLPDNADPDSSDPPQAEGDVPKLSDRAKEILLAMLEMNVVGGNKKKTREFIAEKINRTWDIGTVSRPFSELKAMRLTASSRGRHGSGVWLTVKGKEVALRLKTKQF